MRFEPRETPLGRTTPACTKCAGVKTNATLLMTWAMCACNQADFRSHLSTHVRRQLAAINPLLVNLSRAGTPPPAPPRHPPPSPPLRHPGVHPPGLVRYNFSMKPNRRCSHMPGNVGNSGECLTAVNNKYGNLPCRGGVGANNNCSYLYCNIGNRKACKNNIRNNITLPTVSRWCVPCDSALASRQPLFFAERLLTQEVTCTMVWHTSRF